MRFERPQVSDFGSIAAHTFYRCESGNPDAEFPKDHRDFPTDKFGECSEGHAVVS